MNNETKDKGPVWCRGYRYTLASRRAIGDNISGTIVHLSRYGQYTIAILDNETRTKLRFSLNMLTKYSPIVGCTVSCPCAIKRHDKKLDDFYVMDATWWTVEQPKPPKPVSLFDDAAMFAIRGHY